MGKWDDLIGTTVDFIEANHIDNVDGFSVLFFGIGKHISESFFHEKPRGSIGRIVHCVVNDSHDVSFSKVTNTLIEEYHRTAIKESIWMTTFVFHNKSMMNGFEIEEYNRTAQRIKERISNHPGKVFIVDVAGKQGDYSKYLVNLASNCGGEYIHVRSLKDYQDLLSKIKLIIQQNREVKGFFRKKQQRFEFAFVFDTSRAMINERF